MKYFFSLINFIFVLFSFTLVNGQNQSDKILEIINIVNFSYVDSVNNQKLTDAAIVAMLAELDPHSVYIPKDQVQSMNESLSGSFEGIGVQFNLYNDTVLVISAIPGGPSEKLGITSGDKIISADKIKVSGVGIKNDEIVKLLRGKKGSNVEIGVKKSDTKNEILYTVTRDKIPIYSVDAAYMLDSKTGYIKINRFSSTTFDEFKEAIAKLQKSKMENLILDLRGNGGGFLQTSVQIADELIDGNNLIVSTKGSKHAEQVYKSSRGGMFTEGKLIIIVDDGSASASEILAGAIQDWDRGIILGRRSFGKGLVMKPYTLSDGSVVRLTTSRYYTPSGRSIQKDYNMTKASYANEINERFLNGEFLSLDSIVLPDSLKYKTFSGRTVYGGGGILPDVFIPYDTTVRNKNFQLMLSSGSFSEFSLKYFDSNRTGFRKTYKSETALVEDSVFSIKIVQEFEAFLLVKNILKAPIESHLKFKTAIYLKAYLARYNWNTESYFKVMNYSYGEIEQAMELMNKDDFNWKKLTYQTE